MKIPALSKPERDPEANKRILGIDSSTTGVAWTLVEAGVPVDSGKIRLDKIKEMTDMMQEINNVLPDLLSRLAPDHIFIEMPIFVKNPATARKLTFIVGAVMTNALMYHFDQITLVEPATWKAYLGYTNLVKSFTDQANKKLGKTEANKLCKRLRKEQTQRIVKHRFPKFDVTDDDICDSCAIALYGTNKIGTQILFEKNKEIAFNLPELAGLGLTV